MHRTKPIFQSSFIVILILLSVLSIKANFVGTNSPDIKALNFVPTESGAFDFKIWLSNYNYSNPATSLVVNSDGTITQTNLGSGSIRANTASLSNSNTAYYLTTTKEVWKTMDGGNSFQQLTSFPAPSQGTATDIFASSSDPARVWVVINNGDMSSQCNDGSAWVRVYRSFNGGQTWTYSEVVDPNDYCLREVYRGDAYGNVVYIGGVGQGVGGHWDGVIYVSNDGGITWQRDWSHNELTGPNASSAISSFATPKLGSSAGNVWYATVERRSITFPSAAPYLRGILRKQGGTWSYKALEGCTGCFSGTDKVKVVDIAVDTWEPNLVMVLVEGHGLYRSTTGGDSWTRILADTTTDNSWRIEPDPTMSGHFWLAGKINGTEGLYRTTECGIGAWTQVYAGNVVGNSGTFPSAALAVVSSPIDSYWKDSDGDGLLDRWELFGYDHDNDCQIDVDLPAMGADPLHKDIFIEVDYMMGRVCTDPICPSFSLRPSAAALDKVINAFADAPVSNPDGSTGITLHIDNGPNSVMNPVNGGLWGSLSEANPMALADIAPPNGESFMSRRDSFFEPARRPIFRYLITANKVGEDEVALDCYPKLLGYAMNNDMINYYGAYSGLFPSNFEQAVVFMHELGHTLGLQHGGYDSINDKPNYLSIMNYVFANNGGLIKNSTFGHLDYSRFSSLDLPDLDEEHLNENLGIGGINGYGTWYYTDMDRELRCWIPPVFPVIPWYKNVAPPSMILNANGPIDWNDSGTLDTDIEANINGDLIVDQPPYIMQKYDTLTIRNDWQTLNYPLSGSSLPPSPSMLSLNDVAGEPDGSADRYINYVVAINRNLDLVAPFNVTTMQPITLTNFGLLPTTVNLSATAGNGWFDTSALPTNVTITPGQEIVFLITVTTPMQNSGEMSDQITITATPQEMPTMADSVTLNARIGPVALYEASPMRGTVPLTVNFTNLSLGEVSTYLWDFGDGATSALANPTHVYANPGVYTATLTVSNPYSTDTYTAPQIVVGTQPIIHSLPFTDDMESPHENWQVTNMWLPAALATTSTHEPGTVWKGMNGESALILVDRLDLSTASVPVLSFWHKFVTNTGMGQVVVTTDNGLTWSPVYTITAPITTWTKTVADTNCCGQKSLWTKTVVDLSDYSGEQIGLAFYLRQIEITNAEEGWFIDNVVITNEALTFLPLIQKPTVANLLAPPPSSNMPTEYPGPMPEIQETDTDGLAPPPSSNMPTGYPSP